MKSKGMKGLFDNGVDFTKRNVEKAKGKGKYREDVDDDVGLQREGVLQLTSSFRVACLIEWVKIPFPRI
jgi:hypothetical protein